MSTHTKVFTDDERKGLILTIESFMSRILVESKAVTVIILTIMDHLKVDHGYEQEEAIKTIVSLQSEALRQLADNLEEAFILSLVEMRKSEKVEKD